VYSREFFRRAASDRDLTSLVPNRIPEGDSVTLSGSAVSQVKLPDARPSSAGHKGVNGHESGP
jgi:hypothetical protein